MGGRRSHDYTMRFEQSCFCTPEPNAIDDEVGYSVSNLTANGA